MRMLTFKETCKTTSERTMKELLTVLIAAATVTLQANAKGTCIRLPNQAVVSNSARIRMHGA
jgi:hypothetical protein